MSISLNVHGEIDVTHWRESLNKALSSDNARRQEAEARQSDLKKQVDALRQEAFNHVNSVVLPALEELRQVLSKDQRTLKAVAWLENNSAPRVEMTFSRPGRKWPYVVALLVHSSPSGATFTFQDHRRVGKNEFYSKNRVVNGGTRELTKQVLLDEIISRYQVSLEGED